MKKVSCNEVSTKALRDAAGVCGGLYSLNASGACYYAFNCNGSEVTSGEFCWASEAEDMAGSYDYCIDKTALAGRALADYRRALRRTSELLG